MLGLTQYLQHITESKSEDVKWFRLPISTLPDAVKSCKVIAGRSKIYIENIDNGVKIKVTPENVDKLEPMIEFLTDLANTYHNDKDKKQVISKLQSVIASMSDYIEDLDGE